MMNCNILGHFKNQQERLEELLQFENDISPRNLELLKEAISKFEQITGVECDYEFWKWG